MLADYIVTKPGTTRGYKAHQMVLGLTKEPTTLFVDLGDSLRIRSEKPITDEAIGMRDISEGSICGFELKACVSKKRKGKHIYFPLADWRSRHEWLRKQGERNGFEPLTVTSHSSMLKISDGDKRKFSVDETDFCGVLKVTDPEKFKAALRNGIGSTARTFGFGMLVI